MCSLGIGRGKKIIRLYFEGGREIVPSSLEVDSVHAVLIRTFLHKW